MTEQRDGETGSDAGGVAGRVEGVRRKRRLSGGQLASRVFSPAWVPMLDEVSSLGETAAEAWEAMEARGLIPEGTVGSDRRRFASLLSMSYDTCVIADGPLVTAIPTTFALPKFRTAEQALLGVAAGALVGAGVSWFLNGASGGSVTRRSLVNGALSGAMSVVTGDPEGILRTAKVPRRMPTTSAPPSIDAAVTFARLGDAASSVEQCALEAAFRLQGAQPKIVVWRFHSIYAGSTWCGLRSAENAGALADARRDLEDMIRGDGRGQSIYGPRRLPGGPVTPAMNAEFSRRAANAWDWAVAAGRGDRCNPFAPLYEVWRLGCAVERFDRDAVTVSVPLFQKLTSTKARSSEVAR